MLQAATLAELEAILDNIEYEIFAESMKKRYLQA